MKALMLTHTYAPSVGGGIRYKTAIVDHVRSLGHRMDVLAVSAPGTSAFAPSAHGVVTRVPTWFEANSSAIAPGYLPAFAAVAPEYDVLHFNFPSPMTELALLASRQRVRDAKKVVLYHADIVPAKRFSGPYNRFVTAPFLREMDHVIVSSPKIVDSSPHLQPVRDKVRVIPFGLDPRAFEVTDPPRRSGREGGRLRVLFVGRLSRYKGVDQLITALRDAPGELRIVGKGPLRDGLEAQTSRLGLGDRVTFLGGIPDEELHREYHAADVLVLPSIDAGEAFGYVLLEAMMCGAALISTELGTGTSFVNQDGESGIVVPPKDPGAIAQALRSLDANRDRLRTLQDNAHRRAREVFSLERMLADTMALYG